MTGRTTNTDLAERLANIEGQLTHMATKEHVAILAEQIAQLKERMPELSRNTGRADKREGWDQAKEDSQKDGLAMAALLISTLVAVITAIAFISKVYA